MSEKSANEWHIKNGIVCKTCKHRVDDENDFWTSGHFFYCNKQKTGSVSVGVTKGDGFCNEWEEKDDITAGV